MVGLEVGRRIGKRIRSRRAAERDRRLTARIDGWAARHRVVSTAIAAVLYGLAGWYLAERRDGATTGEIVLWVAILVPVGIVCTWAALTRIKRRNAAKEPTGDR